MRAELCAHRPRPVGAFCVLTTEAADPIMNFGVRGAKVYDMK